MGGFIGDFKSLTPKQWLGIVAAIALALILEIYMGTNCMGFLVVAIVLYMIPHLLKVMSVKVKTVVGVAFIVVAILVGTFAFSGTLANNENLINTDNSQIKDVSYDESTDTIEFYLADHRGQWLGTGMGAWKEMPVLYRQALRFPRSGTYTYTIRHGMRTDPLRGIHDIGMRVEKRE